MFNTPSSPRAHGNIRTLVALGVSIALFLVGCSSVSNDDDVLEQPEPEQPYTSLPVISYTTTSLAVAPDDSPNNSASDSTPTTESPSDSTSTTESPLDSTSTTEALSTTDSSTASNPSEGSSPDSRSVPPITPPGGGHSFEDVAYVFCDESIDIYDNSQSCLLLTEDVIKQVDCIKEPLAEHFGEYFPPGSNFRPILREALHIAFRDPPSEIPASEELAEHVISCTGQASASFDDSIVDLLTEESAFLQIIDIIKRSYCAMAAYSFTQLPIGECRSALSPDGVCVTLAGTIAFGGWDPQTILNNCREIGAELSTWVSNASLGADDDSIEDILESLDGDLPLDDIYPFEGDQNSEFDLESSDTTLSLDDLLPPFIDELNSLLSPDNPDQSVTLTPGETITFSGEGSETISLDAASAEFSQPWILEAVHEGSEKFFITAFDDARTSTEWPVSALGAYRGRHFFGFAAHSPPAFIQVIADGAWTIRLMDSSDPSAASEISSAPGTSFTSIGNDVFRFSTGEQTRILDFECESCEAIISLIAFGDFDWRKTGVILLQWGDGTPFSTRVEVPANTNFLEIAAAQNGLDSGEFTPNEWSIQVQ